MESDSVSQRKMELDSVPRKMELDSVPRKIKSVDFNGLLQTQFSQGDLPMSRRCPENVGPFGHSYLHKGSRYNSMQDHDSKGVIAKRPFTHVHDYLIIA